MNPMLVLSGLALASFGGWSCMVRHHHPTIYGRLESMQRVFGEAAGSVVHLTAFTLIPIALGLILINAGIKGQTLF